MEPAGRVVAQGSRESFLFGVEVNSRLFEDITREPKPGRGRPFVVSRGLLSVSEDMSVMGS